MERSRIGLVIPAFNEADTIYKIVKAAAEFGQPIVINDGSSDATAELAEQAGAIVVNHDVNHGYDFALNSGFMKAASLGCDVIITLDADGQHDTRLLSRFIEELTQGADIVLGVRNKRPRFAEYVFALYTKLKYGIRDPLCGMKAYRTLVYESLGHFDSYKSIGTELLLYGARKKLFIRQIDFIVMDRHDQPRFGRVFSANMKIFRSMIIGIIRSLDVRNHTGPDH